MKQRTMIGIIPVLAILAAIGYVLMNQGPPPSDKTDENNMTLIIPGKSHFGAEETYIMELMA